MSTATAIYDKLTFVGSNISSQRAIQESLVNQSNWGDEGDYKRQFKLTPQDTGSFSLKSTNEGSSGTVFDIVREFRWTYSNFRDEAPRIQLIERQIASNQQSRYLLDATKRLAQRGDLDPYAELYGAAKETGFRYVFPYFSQQNVTVSATWDDNPPAAAESLGVQLLEGSTQGASSVLSSTIDTISKGLKNPIAAAALKTADSFLPTSYMDAYNKALRVRGAIDGNAFTAVEAPIYFNNNAKNAFSVVFPLFNTSSTADIRRNYDFILAFGYQNSYDRKTFSTYNPPVIYECTFDKGHIGELGAKPAMYVESFDVKNVGAVRSIDIGIGSNVAIPEAYLISIRLKEMITMSRAIFSSYFTGGSIVNVYGGS